MSGFDSNPFEETVDVNPFQVRNSRTSGEALLWGLSGCLGEFRRVCVDVYDDDDDDDGSFGSDEFGSAVDVSWSRMRCYCVVAGEGCVSAQVL